MTMNRRDVLFALSIGGAAISFPSLQQGARHRPGSHEVVPLPFDPTKLHGLSEKLLVSHHANNYAGAVKNLNNVEAELATVTADSPPFLVTALRERELTFRNSATLHELYFGNLGGDGKITGTVAEAVTAAFGSTDRFVELFRATALGLAGGSGWVLLGYDLHRNDLAICGSGGHTQTLASCLPLLVLDMYEHSYHLDYGAAAARYVDAFMANVHAEELDRRLVKARKASAAMRT